MNPKPQPSLDQWIERLPATRVLVVGDVMLDQFVLGRVDRISPEAPVPVVRVNEEESRLGGAANVAANVAALGCQVSLAGAIGPGAVGDQLVALVSSKGIDTGGIVRESGRLTTVKTRILGGGQQIVRIDRETPSALGPVAFGSLLSILDTSSGFDVVIISDYDKGVVTEPLMERMRALAGSGVPVVVDPKQGDFSLYRNTTCITPNTREAGAATHDVVDGDASALRVGNELRERLELEMVLLTRGEQGISLIGAGGAATHLPTEASRVFDVTGAGDTVIATFAALLGVGAPGPEAARLANWAAGVVVRKLGTATVSARELAEAAGQEPGASRP